MFIVVSLTFDGGCCLGKGDLFLGRLVMGKCCVTCLFVDDLVGRVSVVIMPLFGFLRRIRVGRVVVDGVMEKEVVLFINELLRLGMIMGLGFDEEGEGLVGEKWNSMFVVAMKVGLMWLACEVDTEFVSVEVVTGCCCV